MCVCFFFFFFLGGGGSFFAFYKCLESYGGCGGPFLGVLVTSLFKPPKPEVFFVLLQGP